MRQYTRVRGVGIAEDGRVVDPSSSRQDILCVVNVSALIKNGHGSADTNL